MAEVKDEVRSENESEAILNISLPDVITLEHWEKYQEGREEYEKSLLPGRFGANILARYSGALALIRAGFVHVTGLPEAVEVLKRSNQKNTNLAVIGWVVKHVCEPVEAQFNVDLKNFYGS